jgi:hypothetical protein
VAVALPPTFLLILCRRNHPALQLVKTVALGNSDAIVLGQ